MMQPARTDQPKPMPVEPIPEAVESGRMADLVAASWRVVAPFWPLGSLVAVNPLRGFEEQPIEKAIAQAAQFFERPDLPSAMQDVNRVSIKWLQAFLDQGQATIPMPHRARGLYESWRSLAPHDAQLHGGDPARRAWLNALPANPLAMIAQGLLQLGIAQQEQELFLTLLLTTLPGWASAVQARVSWGAPGPDHPISHSEYLALRMAITCALWPSARQLLALHRADHDRVEASAVMARITTAEDAYRLPLLRQLAAPKPSAPAVPNAQLVFCIDVRSEPMRRALESAGAYETYGFAGFFGVPMTAHDAQTGHAHASCPVLLKPQYRVTEFGAASVQPAREHHLRRYRLEQLRRRLYQSLKYGFTTPFALAEMLGPLSGLWMALRSFAPRLASHLPSRALSWLAPEATPVPQLDEIGDDAQSDLAFGALRGMGLTQDFAPLVVLCGHGSTTCNNAYASALDCGACGGHPGAPNARALAAILNRDIVRAQLRARGIEIPATTRFIAAQHDTTTDVVTLYRTEQDAPFTEALHALERDLRAAGARVAAERAARLEGHRATQAEAQAMTRSRDWSQVRPEWGLARNAAFIVAPRALTQGLNLDGRSFLHSYDPQHDADGAILAGILSAPMVVAQWINTQYLFSTLNPVAYGGGSKVTKNIAGKLGVMQGNASDLMTGLPLQSVYADERTPYHETQRLLCVINAPRARIDGVIAATQTVRNLFAQGWVSLACIEPQSREIWQLQRDLSWQRAA